jgi:hypothetical protein
MAPGTGGLWPLRGEAEVSPAAWTPAVFNDDQQSMPGAAGVDRSSPPEAKVALFRSLFAGRDDVHALRWENNRTGKAGWGRRCGAAGRTPGARIGSTCRSPIVSSNGT